MDLELCIISYHRLSQEQSANKRFSNGGTIGRSEQNDWHLPEPERVMSGTHARIEKRGEEYYISDLSTNGLFINRSVQALGQSDIHKLEHGDILTLADYEIEVKLASENPVEAFAPQVARPETPPAPAPASDNVGINDFDFNNVNSLAPKIAPQVAADMDDFFSLPNQQPFQEPGAGGHSSAIPEDWNFDSASTFGSENDIPAEPAPVVPAPAPVVPAPAPVVPAPAPAPVVPAPAPAPVVPAPAPVVPAPAPVAPEPAPVAPAPVAANPAQTAAPDAAMMAFLSGLGLSNNMLPAQVNEQWWQLLGSTMQELLLGLMEALRHRAALKGEFRVNQTTFQQQENNPLKFSAGIEDAFFNLFNRSGKSFMPANEAVKASFNDIKSHDSALIAGTQGAIKGILAQLSPERIESNDPGSAFSIGSAGRYWKIYREVHQDLDSNFKQKSSASFSEDFVNAYDHAIKNNK